MSTNFSNGLSPAEAERLAMLAEEAGEVVQACMKVLRHGYGSYNPDRPEDGDNRVQLAREIGNFDHITTVMFDCGDYEMVGVREGIDRQKRNMSRYAHFDHRPA
jgi:hypothetical protein